MIPILIHFVIITAIIIIIRSIAMIFLGLLFLCWLCVQLPNRSKTEVWEKSWGFWGYALSDPNVAKLPTIPTKKLHLTLSEALSTKFSLKYLKIIYIQAWKVTFLWISQITAHNVFLSYILLPAITVIIDCLFLIKSFQHTNLLQCIAAYWVQKLDLGALTISV